MKKLCTGCNTEKSYDAFHKKSASKDGRYHCCKVCRKAQAGLYYKKNTDKLKNRAKAWAIDNPEKARAIALKYLYNFTEEQYNEILKCQRGCCAICLTPAEKFSDKLCIDHDHTCCPSKRSCGKCIRGLLCSTCNKGIGYFHDDCAKLERAIKYVRKGKSAKKK